MKSHSYRKNQSGAAHIFALLFFVALVGAVGFVGYNAWQKQTSNAGSKATVGRAERATNTKMLVSGFTGPESQQARLIDANTMGHEVPPRIEATRSIYGPLKPSGGYDTLKGTFAMSPNAKDIAWISLVNSPQGPSGGYKMNVASLDSTEPPVKTIELGGLEKGAHWQGVIEWSPDGKWLHIKGADRDETYPQRASYITKSDLSGSLKKITEGVGSAWMADSKSLISVDDSYSQLCVTPIDTTQQKTCNYILPYFSSKEGTVDARAASMSATDVTADGRVLMTARLKQYSSETVDLVSIGLDGRNGKVIETDGSARNIDNAVWSPDGKKIAYTAMNASGMHTTSNGMLVMMNADGSSPQHYGAYVDYKNYDTIKKISWPGKKPLGYQIYGSLSSASSVKRGKTISSKMTFKNSGTKSVKVSVTKTTIDPNRGATKTYEKRTLNLKPGRSVTYTVAKYKVSKNATATKAKIKVSGSITGGDKFSFDKTFTIKR